MLAFDAVVFYEFEQNVKRERDLETISTALTNHLEADMMHVALRSDILSATLTGIKKDESTGKDLLKELDNRQREILQLQAFVKIKSYLKPKMTRLASSRRVTKSKTQTSKPANRALTNKDSKSTAHRDAIPLEDEFQDF